MCRLSEDEIRTILAALPRWRLAGNAIERNVRTGEWKWTVLAFNAAAYPAQAAKHRPDVALGYARLVVRLITHDADGVSEKEVSPARETDGALARFDEFYRTASSFGSA